MKRIDTMSKRAKIKLEETIKFAKRYSFSDFICFGLGCHECPFHDGIMLCVANGSGKVRTADEWRAWAEEEV